MGYCPTYHQCSLIPNHIIRHTCGLLGTLATIYRQRGTDLSLKECEEVLDMEETFLLICKEIAQLLRDMRALQCIDELEYKYNIIRFNYYLENVQNVAKCEPYFSDLLDYEVRHNIDFDNQNYLFMLLSINIDPTSKNVANLTKKQRIKILNIMLEMVNKEEGQQRRGKESRRVALKKCNGCGSVESAMDEYKACSRCREVCYCSRDCQMNDWKLNKKICNKSSKKSTTEK